MGWEICKVPPGNIKVPSLAVLVRVVASAGPSPGGVASPDEDAARAAETPIDDSDVIHYQHEPPRFFTLLGYQPYFCHWAEVRPTAKGKKQLCCIYWTMKYDKTKFE